MQILLKKYLKFIEQYLCFVYSCIFSTQFKSQVQLFCLRIAVNAFLFSSCLLKPPRFQSDIPLISFIYNQMYHPIDGFFFASSKCGN